MKITFKLESTDDQVFELSVLNIDVGGSPKGASQKADGPSVSTVQAPSRFVTVKMASAVTGLSEIAIRNRISRGDWLEGREYVRREGRIFIDLQGYERWVLRGSSK